MKRGPAVLVMALLEIQDWVQHMIDTDPLAKSKQIDPEPRQTALMAVLHANERVRSMLDGIPELEH